MIRYIKTFEVIFSTNNLSGMHISTMWHILNVLKYFCPLSVYVANKIYHLEDSDEAEIRCSRVRASNNYNNNHAYTQPTIQTTINLSKE